MKITKNFVRDSLLWGFVLWLAGYIAGIVLFALVPVYLIGWFITPFAVAFTLWILFKKVQGDSLQYYMLVGIVWLVIAMAGDYLFIVKAFHPEDGYYKPDVYMYYLFTLLLPVFAGWRKVTRKA